MTNALDDVLMSLANVRYMLSPVCLSVVCLSPVTFVHPTQAVQIFGNISMALGTLAIRWHPLKISRISSQGNPSAGGVKRKRVAKYSDFGPIDDIILETVQDRSKLVLFTNRKSYMSFRLVPKSVYISLSLLCLTSPAEGCPLGWSPWNFQ